MLFFWWQSIYYGSSRALQALMMTIGEIKALMMTIGEIKALMMIFTQSDTYASS
jgi:hypothetical protein